MYRVSNAKVLVCAALACVGVVAIALTQKAPSATSHTSTCSNPTCAWWCTSPNKGLTSIVIFGLDVVQHQADELQRVLLAKGHTVTVARTLDALDVSKTSTLYILLMPHLVRHFPTHFILYQTVLWSELWSGLPWGSVQGSNETSDFRQVLHASMEAWDFTKWNIEHYSENGKSVVKHVPFVWFPYESAASTLLRDIDVMFCGDAIGNKQQLKTLAQLGVNITIARPTLTNQDIDALFLRSKIVLNLQQGDGLLEATRTMHALSLQTMVISEPAMDPKLQEDLSHAVVFASSMFSLSNTISYFLQHEADRLKSTENAYAFAKERLNAEFFLSQTCVTEFMA